MRSPKEITPLQDATASRADELWPADTHGVNPVPRTYVRAFGALRFGQGQNIHPRTHVWGGLWYGVKRWHVLLLVGILLLLCAGVLGFRLAVQMLKGRVVEALGPGSEVTELKIGWSSIEMVGLSIEAPRGWPAERILYAERVRIVPNLRSLLANQIHISSIAVEKPYLSVLRLPGKLLILPGLLEGRAGNKQRKGDEEVSPGAGIDKIVLENGTMDLFDATVRQPPLKIRLEEIEAVVRDIAPANLQDRVRFELAAVAKGKTRDGGVKVSGWVGNAGKDSLSHVVMKDVDVVTLEPYLVKSGEARVRKGTLDLNLKSAVRNNQLEGAGNMIIRELAFAPAQSALGTFMGIPRSAVISFLKDHNNAINLDFTLSGDIRHPNFSLNETLATRIASGMAEQLGVSLGGMAEGLEALGRKGLESASGAAGAIGSALRGLFSGGEKQ